MTTGESAVSLRQRVRRMSRACRPRYLVALLVVVTGMTLSFAVDRSLARSAEQDLRDDLAVEADVLVGSIETVLSRVETRLIAVAGLFRASQHIDRSEFAQFAADLGLLDGMGGYGFAPLVSHRTVDEFEAETARDHPGFVVFGLDERGNRVPRPSVAYHAPLVFFWPFEAFGVPPIGLDLMSEPVRARTIEDSLRRGGTTLTPFLVLLDEDDGDGFIAIHPVVAPNGTTTIGFLTAPIDLSLLLDVALPASTRDELAWRVVDVATGHRLEPEATMTGPTVTRTIAFGGREWTIEVGHRPGSTHVSGVARADVMRPGIVATVLAGLVVLLMAGILEEHRKRRDLEAIIGARDRFLASVSHELRSPLTGVIGFLDEALGREEIGLQERREMVSLAANQAHEMADIIDDLITATRGDISEVATSPQRFDLMELTRSVTALFPDGAALTGPDTVPVWADPARVRQILRNLLGNAARHGRPPIEIAVDHAGVGARLEVRDHGSGIDPTREHLLFRPHQPLHAATGQPQSLGLGLWISHRLAERMGGSLTYSSQPHPSFVLTLPTEPSHPTFDREPGTNPAFAPS